MKTARLFFSLGLGALLLAGCVAVDAVGTAVGTTVSAVGTVVETTADVVTSPLRK